MGILRGNAAAPCPAGPWGAELGYSPALPPTRQLSQQEAGGQERIRGCGGGVARSSEAGGGNGTQVTEVRKVGPSKMTNVCF